MHHAAVDMVGNERAAWAAFHPSRAEHKVIHNQLASSPEKIGESFLALWPVEDVGLLYFLPREFAALPAQFISQPRELLLFLQQLLARGKPCCRRHDLWVFHRSRCHD